MNAPVFKSVGEESPAAGLAPSEPRSVASVVGFAVGVAAACWLVGAAAGYFALPSVGVRFDWGREETELAAMGLKYFGGMGLYVGAMVGVTRALRFARRPEAAAAWRRRFWSFHATVLAICALGAVLGALVFPFAGRLGGAQMTAAELARAGAKTGGFFFMVWAPGFALVREFIRGARMKQRLSDAGAAGDGAGGELT